MKDECGRQRAQTVKMFGFGVGGWVDLKGEVVDVRVLEKAVDGTEYLVREQEEKLTVKCINTGSVSNDPPPCSKTPKQRRQTLKEDVPNQTPPLHRV
jgi:hypothetical protein